jgi:hypothetical protein
MQSEKMMGRREIPSGRDAVAARLSRCTVAVPSGCRYTYRRCYPSRCSSPSCLVNLEFGFDGEDGEEDREEGEEGR